MTLLASAPEGELVRYQLPGGSWAVLVVARGVHADCLWNWATKHCMSRQTLPNNPRHEAPHGR